MNKLTGFMGVLTISSIASLSNVATFDLTTTGNNQYCYESISFIDVEQGDLCVSSELNDCAVGDRLTEIESQEMGLLSKHKMIEVKLHITEVKKHISNFDFEEEFEEI